MQTTSNDLWPDIHDEREVLLEFLETLTPQQWDAPTLCSKWRVRDVVGHMVGGTEVTMRTAILAMVASGFRINRYIENDGRRRGAKPVAELLGDFRNAMPRTTHPPG